MDAPVQSAIDTGQAALAAGGAPGERPGTLGSADLAPVAPATRRALRTALLQLDLQRAHGLLAEIRMLHGDKLADEAGAMLARHRYPELCALLDQSLASA